MKETTYKINTDIVSTTMKDKPLIFISEEAINLKRDNDNLKSIIKEVREYIETNKENTTQTLRFDENKSYNTALLELLGILDKVSNNDSD